MPGEPGIYDCMNRVSESQLLGYSPFAPIEQNILGRPLPLYWPCVFSMRNTAVEWWFIHKDQLVFCIAVWHPEHILGSLVSWLLSGDMSSLGEFFIYPQWREQVNLYSPSSWWDRYAWVFAISACMRPLPQDQQPFAIKGLQGRYQVFFRHTQPHTIFSFSKCLLRNRRKRKTHCLLIYREEARSSVPLLHVFRLHTRSCLPTSLNTVDLPAADGCQSLNFRYQVKIAQCQYRVFEISWNLLASHGPGSWAERDDNCMNDWHIRMSSYWCSIL